MRLAARDLWFHRGAWAWTLLVLVVGATGLGSVLSAQAGVAAAMVRHGDVRLAGDLQSLTSVLVSCVAAVACAVIATSTRLVVVSSTRSWALWRVLGLSARRVRRMLLLQVTALALVAGATAAVVAPLVAPGYLRTWAVTGLPVERVHPVWSPAALVTTGLATVGVALVGAIGPIRAAGRVDEVQALREAALPRSTVTWRGVAAAVVLSGIAVPCLVTGHCHGVNGSGQPDAIVAALLSLLVATLSVSSWTLRAVSFAWSSLLPAGTPTWRLARAAVQQRGAQSVSASLPGAVALSVLGTLYGVVAVGGGQVRGVGMLLWLLLPISAAGGIGTVAMCGAQRRADARVLALLGVPRRQRTLVNLLEGGSHGITGALFGWAWTLLAVTATAVLLHLPRTTGFGHLPWRLLSVLTVAAVVLPAITAATTGRTRRD